MSLYGGIICGTVNQIQGYINAFTETAIDM